MQLLNFWKLANHVNQLDFAVENVISEIDMRL